MKFFPLIFFLLLITTGLYAQERGIAGNPSQPDMQQIDSLKNKTEQVESKIEVWTLENQYSTIAPVELDTASLNFHNYNPIFKKSISNSYLGYLGAPYQSNIFFDREEDPDGFYFLKNMQHYYKSPDEVEYYNTTTPFAILKYHQGGVSTTVYEQMFTAFYTRNIDPGTNFGFCYDALKNAGQYVYQESLHEHLNVFFSKNSERYNAYASILTGTNMVVENGGAKANVVNPYTNPDRVTPNLGNSIETSIKNLSFFTSHEYLLGSLSSLFKKGESTGDAGSALAADTSIVLADTSFVMTDSARLLADSTKFPADSTKIISDSNASNEFVPAYSIQYSLEYNRLSRFITENYVDEFFFDTTYLSLQAPYTDSALYNTFNHILQLKAFENPNRRFTFGKRVYLENEFVEAAHPVPYGQAVYTYSNLYLGGEIYRSEGKFWSWNASARVALLGRNMGDAVLKGSIHKPLRIFGDTTYIVAEGWYSDKRAPLFIEHWQGNHFKWENRFKKQHEIVVKGKISYPRIKLHTGVNFALLSNYIYFNENAVPDQYAKEFSVFSFWINKDFHLGPFCWSNKVVVQQATDNTALHLPLASAYSSATFSGVLFKVMKYQLGAEIYYHTPFYAESYQPATTSFYLQNDQLIGGFPYVNVFLNAKLKRTSAFVMYQHANSWISAGNYFGAAGYPLNRAALRFGFLWTFYD